MILAPNWRIAAEDDLTAAEALGLAWVAHRMGGTVCLCGGDPRRVAAVRAWLPADAPLTFADGPGEALPQGPWSPVELSSLPRSGVPPFPDGCDLGTALRWIASREPRVLVADAPPTPELAVALGAIAGQGWKVLWRLSAAHLDGRWAQALDHIAARGLPLTLIVDGMPSVATGRWWVSRPASRAQTLAALVWHLQQDWPGILLADGTEDGTTPAAWLPDPPVLRARA